MLVETICVEDHHLTTDDFEVVGKVALVCTQIVLQCLYIARFGRPDMLWTVDTLAKAVTEWNRACDQRVATKDNRQFCHVDDQVVKYKLGLSLDASFAGDLKRS